VQKNNHHIKKKTQNKEESNQAGVVYEDKKLPLNKGKEANEGFRTGGSPKF